jgi:hypothetical protein
MEGVIALMIPVLALSIGLVRVMRMPPEALAGRRYRRYRRHAAPAPQSPALADEVALLREEVFQLRERLDFTERLLSGAPAGAALPATQVRVPSASSVSA